MNCKIKIIILFTVLASIYLSCATIISGSKQAIRLESNPPGANVTINGKEMQLTTPCMVSLKRKVKPGIFNNKNEYHYLFTKEGYTNYEYIDRRRINPTIYFDVFTYLLMVISVPIDFMTGASYKYNGNVFANLQQLQIVNYQDITENKIKKEDEDRLPPEIKVYSPDLDRGFKPVVAEELLIVSGKAEDPSGIHEVTVNGIQATVIEDGSFEANIQLKTGNNKITISAKDGKMNVALQSFYIERNETIVIPDIPTDDTGELGTYHALIIGVKDYEDESFNDLDYPLKDAKRLYETLTQYYHFDKSNVVLLENPDMDEITAKLEYYFNKLSTKDNLLVFYAGHGYWDQKFKQGYWIASDARMNNRGTWLSNSTIRDYIRAIPCRHSLLVTDACFSGAIFKSRDASSNPSKAIKQLYYFTSRKAMTSGALKQVPDKSVFIDYLIQRLEENQEKYLSAEQLFSSFKLAVINNSPQDQVPQFGEIKETGDEGGDFIFIKN